MRANVVCPGATVNHRGSPSGHATGMLSEHTRVSDGSLTGPQCLLPEDRKRRGSNRRCARDIRSADTCQGFRVVRIGPWPGATVMRLSVSVRRASQVVRPGGSQVGSRARVRFMAARPAADLRTEVGLGHDRVCVSPSGFSARAGAVTRSVYRGPARCIGVAAPVCCFSSALPAARAGSCL